MARPFNFPPNPGTRRRAVWDLLVSRALVSREASWSEACAAYGFGKFLSKHAHPDVGRTLRAYADRVGRGQYRLKDMFNKRLDSTGALRAPVVPEWDEAAIPTVSIRTLEETKPAPLCDMCEHEHEQGFFCNQALDADDYCVCAGRRFTRGVMPKFGAIAIASPRHGKTEALKRAEERSWAQLLNSRLDALERKQDAILAAVQDVRSKLDPQ